MAGEVGEFLENNKEAAVANVVNQLEEADKKYGGRILQKFGNAEPLANRPNNIYFLRDPDVHMEPVNLAQGAQQEREVTTYYGIVPGKDGGLVSLSFAVSPGHEKNAYFDKELDNFRQNVDIVEELVMDKGDEKSKDSSRGILSGFDGVKGELRVHRFRVNTTVDNGNEFLNGRTARLIFGEVDGAAMRKVFDTAVVREEGLRLVPPPEDNVVSALKAFG